MLKAMGKLKVRLLWIKTPNQIGQTRGGGEGCISNEIYERKLKHALMTHLFTLRQKGPSKNGRVKVPFYALLLTAQCGWVAGGRGDLGPPLREQVQKPQQHRRGFEPTTRCPRPQGGRRTHSAKMPPPPSRPKCHATRGTLNRRSTSSFLFSIMRNRLRGRRFITGRW